MIEKRENLLNQTKIFKMIEPYRREAEPLGIEFTQETAFAALQLTARGTLRKLDFGFNLITIIEYDPNDSEYI